MNYEQARERASSLLEIVLSIIKVFEPKRPRHQTCNSSAKRTEREWPSAHGQVMLVLEAASEAASARARINGDLDQGHADAERSPSLLASGF